MFDCGSLACINERRIIKKELMRWSKTTLLVTGLEACGEQFKHGKSWRMVEKPHLAFLPASAKGVDWRPGTKCEYCLAKRLAKEEARSKKLALHRLAKKLSRAGARGSGGVNGVKPYVDTIGKAVAKKASCNEERAVEVRSATADEPLDLTYTNAGISCSSSKGAGSGRLYDKSRSSMATADLRNRTPVTHNIAHRRESLRTGNAASGRRLVNSTNGEAVDSRNIVEHDKVAVREEGSRVSSVRGGLSDLYPNLVQKLARERLMAPAPAPTPTPLAALATSGLAHGWPLGLAMFGGGITTGLTAHNTPAPTEPAAASKQECAIDCDSSLNLAHYASIFTNLTLPLLAATGATQPAHHNTNTLQLKPNKKHITPN